MTGSAAAILTCLLYSGLLLDNKVDLAKGVAEHFCFEISKFHMTFIS